MKIKPTLAVMVFTTVVNSHMVDAGGICSARDGTKYCTCEYDKKCVSEESGCNCVGYSLTLPQPTRPKLHHKTDLTKHKPIEQTVPLPPATVVKPDPQVNPPITVPPATVTSPEPQVKTPDPRPPAVVTTPKIQPKMHERRPTSLTGPEY